MRIERVDDKTVKCFISNEELEEYQIDYKDFVVRSDKAREIVQEIMEQAEEEVGYKPPKFAFDLQIMMLPDQGLLLTFSEKEPGDFKEGQQILDCLKDMKEMLQKTKEKIGGTAQPEGQLPGMVEKVQGSGKGKEDKRPDKGVFIFGNLGTVMEYAKVLPANLRVNSSLYLMEGYYFLVMEKGGASYERYSRACIQALEFAGLYASDDSRIMHLKEHGECLLEEKALKKLRG